MTTHTHRTPTGALSGTAISPVVTVERDLEATTEEVWAAWTDPDRLVPWLGAIEAPLTTRGRPVRVAMAAETLPDDPAQAQNPATFTVLEADPPVDGGSARLLFTFDDVADPGGTVTVTMTPVEHRRCRLVLQHRLLARADAIANAPAFGAGWEGFLDWLTDALADRPRGEEDAYVILLPAYEQMGRQLGARVEERQA